MDYSGKSNRINRREKQKSKKQPYSSKHVRTKENLLNKPKGLHHSSCSDPSHKKQK